MGLAPSLHTYAPPPIQIHLMLLMANFMCYLDWTMGCPDSWLSVISGCVRVFLKDGLPPMGVVIN
jgi:hypothetical protein